MGETGRAWSSRSLVLSIAFLVLALAHPVNATNFGSNTAAGGTPAHSCDTSHSSQCIANNGNHAVFDFNLNAGWHTAVNNAIVVHYDPVTDVSAAWTTNSSTADAYGNHGSYGVNGQWGWTLCSGSATYGGSDPDRWCKYQWMTFNDSYAQTPTQKDAIACHELGHTLGLRHSNESSASCMIKDQRTWWALSDHDRTRLNQQY
jgi:matrixin